MREQLSDGNTALKHLFHLGDQLDRLERLTTQQQKIIIGVNPINLEHLLPNSAQLRFHLRYRTL
ncbi:hypothetical protein D3C85_1865400 [compost metagenome]